MSFVDANGLTRVFTKLKSLIDKKQDSMEYVSIPTSSASNKNKWVKFATIDLSSAGSYIPCSGTLSFIERENNSPVGQIKFRFRNGQTAGILQDAVIRWTSLGDSTYADSIAFVKTSEGKGDLYYQPKQDWETPWVSLIDSINPAYFTFNTGSYIDSITALSISYVESCASFAARATKATSADSVPSLTSDDIDAVFTEVFG